LSDVKGVGRKHEIKNVADGYGNNYLLAKRLAELATAQAVKDNELRIKNYELRKGRDIEGIKNKLTELDSKTFEIKRLANEQGTLFDSLDKKEIAELLKINPDWIILEHPLKHTGAHTIELVHADVKANVIIKIGA